jgi:hypothetical protein
MEYSGIGRKRAFEYKGVEGAMKEIASSLFRLALFA